MRQIHHRGRRLAKAATVVTASVGVLLSITSHPAAAAGPACTVVYTSPPAYNWDGGFQADIALTNNGGPIDGWVLKWQFTAGQGMTAAFNAYYTQIGPTVWASNMPYNSAIPAGGTIRISIVASRGATNPPPAAFFLNSDYQCELDVS